MLILYGERGWGSAIVEAQLVFYGLDYEFRAVGDLFDDPAAGDALEAINPLRQIPTLILDDGAVLTDSAAITLLLAEQAERRGAASLAPAADAADRARFLRWLIFIVANIYPTYTYADDPGRFVTDAVAQGPFADAVNARAKVLYGVLDAEAGAPFFLGERLSALDVFIATLTHWRPRRPWFNANAPRLAAIAERTLSDERFGSVWAENFAAVEVQ